MICLFCDEPILLGEPLEEFGCLTEGGPMLRRAHWECAARQVVGSVGHQRRTCSCYGGSEEDPEGLTRREAAVAAVKEARMHRTDLQ